MSDFIKTGYLNSDFKIFYLDQLPDQEVPYHFHDFHKIIFIESGELPYKVEGQTYFLHTNNLILIPAGEVHCPILNQITTYHRLILYISPDYLHVLSPTLDPLDSCFIQAKAHHSYVLSPRNFENSPLSRPIFDLLNEISQPSYAHDFLLFSLFLELMVQINRYHQEKEAEDLPTTSSNEKLLDILSYINNHLQDDLNVDQIANHFFLSRYHLMHLFKEETGYTIGNYISSKRLILAKDMINHGASITEACYSCGFKNYSTFSRAYNKHYGCAPSNHRSILTTTNE